MWNDGNQPKQGSRLASDDSARPTNLDSQTNSRTGVDSHMDERIDAEQAGRP